jgi:hypothetical protein
MAIIYGIHVENLREGGIEGILEVWGYGVCLVVSNVCDI